MDENIKRISLRFPLKIHAMWKTLAATQGKPMQTWLFEVIEREYKSKVLGQLLDLGEEGDKQRV